MFGPGRFAIALAIGCTAACAAATAGGRAAAEPTLTQSTDAQLAKEQAMPWAQRRPLTWADFKAEPPRDAGSVAAETAYTLIHGARCARDKFEARVIAAFRPNDSWVRHAMLKAPGASARALHHEQTHFDLTEVHARRLRRYFAELYAPCRLSTDDMAAAAGRITRDERAAQAQYDSETDHGRSLVQQARWEKEVAGQLVALAKYAR